ncbi:type VI secretion system baseplate subunit TssG [Telluria beijingensis]|uniref:type VI secretion system baseplate subunit TssG n=1 Tax=Telluria beijingensis TaxID=3068633 RepID=UPI002795A296|nr:type VI secretion system baseplate subunit TssG [Massilia sp. REN29]
MRAQKRRTESPVIERLLHEPWRFEFFQAVRMLELWLKRRGRPAHGLVADMLRFRNSISLGFPASQLEAIEPELRDLEIGMPFELPVDAAALGDALEQGTLRRVHLTPAFMGLLGGHGVLPAHYTERIAEHQARYKNEDEDQGPRAFLDAFSNRSLALFYEAWRKYRLPFKYQLDGQDAFLPLLLSLAGLGDAALRRRLDGADDGAVLDESIAYFAAAVRHRPVSAVQMARVLSEYFGEQVEAEQFVGSWYDVPLAQQTVLGQDSAVLGTRAIAGARVWQRSLRLRLVVGPLAHAGFQGFLPGGLAARALKSVLALFTGVALEYEVEVVLRAADVHNTTLDELHPGRLGWDAFLVLDSPPGDRHDVRYDLHAAGHDA